MKVLLIDKFLFPKGGASICTLETGKLLIKNGHDVAFWGMKHPLNKELPFQDFFVSNVDYNKKTSIWQQVKSGIKILYSLEAKSKISNLLACWRPDIVHLNNFAHHISPSILSVFIKYKIPAVMTLHDYKLICPTYLMLLNGRPCEKCKKGKFYNCLINKCTKNSILKSLINTMEMYLHHKILNIYDSISLFISPSIFLMEKVKEMGFNGNIVYLPNFVELGKYKPSYDYKDKAIVYFGRLSKEKGVGNLINAVKDLDVELKVVGSGPYEDELRNKVNGENIGNVYFLGYKEGKELIKIISESLFAVIPSAWYENNPISVLESFALGKPVIGSRIGGIPELVIDGKTGFTFKAGDSAVLKEKIKYLLDNTNKIKVLGRNARKFVEKNFNPEKHYKELIEIYKMEIDRYK